MALPNGLLDAVKNYLDITWDDTAGEEKLSGIISRGMKYLNKIAGAYLDYTVEDKPRELLMDYVRYVRSNALDEFQNNYLHELLSLQIATEVANGIAEASISALIIGNLTLTPAFAATVYEYTAAAVAASDTVTATPAKRDAGIRISVNGTVIENKAMAAWLSGENIVKVITMYGGISLTYVIVVTR